MRHATVGMALVAPDGSFLEVNRALCAMLGRTEAELRASTWQQLTHPDDVAIDSARVQGLFDGERDDYRLSKRYVRPDGSIVHGDLSVACVRLPSGAIDYFISQITDVTEAWKMAERHRLLAENVSDVVALGDNDGRLVWVLPSVTALMGWEPEELTGVAFRDLVHPDDLHEVTEAQAAVSRGEPGQFEARLRTKSRGYRWMNVRVRPVLDSDERWSGAWPAGGTGRRSTRFSRLCPGPRSATEPRWRRSSTRTPSSTPSGTTPGRSSTSCTPTRTKRH